MAFEHFNPLKSSPGSHSQSIVGIMSSCSLLAFLAFHYPHIVASAMWPLLLGIYLNLVTVLDYS